MTADAETESPKEQFAFQAEIKRLLHLLSESLYQNREITIRELVSNASDALDKLRYESLTDSSADAGDLRVTLLPDAEKHILTIRDNGIGMTREDLVRNLGTIAHSGSLEFLQEARDSETKDPVSLIGQFGVGFYSAFMLADQVEVRTRHRSESGNGWVWESAGDGSFTIVAAENPLELGTEIRLHLKKGMDEFTEVPRLKHILRTYSTFVPHPVYLNEEHVNDQRPIWLEPKSAVTDEQYQGLFEYLVRFPGQKPQWHLHLSADSPFQFNAVLFCPESNIERMGFGRAEHGLHLCAKRVLVQNDNRDLLPDYLRFLRGVVDSEDLPLNVSREALQDNTVFRKMRKVITKKVLEHLDSLATDDSEQYAAFYREFGSTLREGMGEDPEQRDRLAGLLRFRSTHPVDHDLTSLSDYCGRISEDQTQIYFVSGSDETTVLRDPNLEVFRKRNLEVLVITDPVDEYVLATLGNFGERSIVSVDSAELKLPGESTEAAEDSDESEKPSNDEAEGDSDAFKALMDVFRKALGDTVEDVRRSARLTESACCLVNASGSLSTTMQKVLKMNTPDFELSRMVLEVNPDSPLIERLTQLASNEQNHDFVSDCARQLHANAMIMAGLAPDGGEMADRVQRFMLDLAEKRSSIIL